MKYSIGRNNKPISFFFNIASVAKISATNANMLFQPVLSHETVAAKLPLVTGTTIYPLLIVASMPTKRKTEKDKAWVICINNGHVNPVIIIR